ncbi:WxL domain-containing protein [Enterococcus casseliflavus]
MITRLRKPMLVLVNIILMIQALFIPMSTVYARTTMTTDQQEQVEPPPIKNYLEEQDSDPRFFFTHSRIKGRVEEPLQVTFFSDQEVSEVRISIPKEMKLIQDQLQHGISVIQEEQSCESVIQVEGRQQKFVLPVVVESEGSYEVSIEETTVTLEISGKEEMEQDYSKEINENHNQEQNTDEQTEELKEKNLTESEETIPQKTERMRQTYFKGKTVEVNTFDELRLAVANSDVGMIEVRNNLTRSGTGSTTAIGLLNRSLLIKGNGFTINFGADNGSIQLAEISEEASEMLRIENAILSKTGGAGGGTAIVAGEGNAGNWTIQFENITEGSTNTSRIVNADQARLHFTGGINQFSNTSTTQMTVFQAKEFIVDNSSMVTVTRTNNSLFWYSGLDSANLTIRDNSVVNVTTGIGNTNDIYLRGTNASIEILENSQLNIQTQGTTVTATNEVNNSVAMIGNNPSISVTNGSSISVDTTNAKRGIVLNGGNPFFSVDSSMLTVTSATQAAIQLIGSEPVFSVTNSYSDLRSTTGATLSLNGERAKIRYEGGTGSLTSTTGQRVNLIGDNPQFYVEQTELSMSASTGRGIYLQGLTPQIFLENSQLNIDDTGSSQGIILQGEEALLSLSNHSKVQLTGAGNGTAENIQIGNNNARPELSVTGRSELSVTTTSGTGTASEATNNAIHLRGSNPKATITDGSELKVLVTSNARRGVYLNGDNAELTVKDSCFDLITVSGQTLNITGTSPKMILNKAKSRIVSTTGQRMNLIGSNPVLDLKSSELEMNATIGRGIYLQGLTPQVLLDDSQIYLTDTGSSQGMILEGTDALLSLSNQSELHLSGEGTGTTENIQIGSNNARPKVLVTEESELSVTTTSGNGSASVTANNAIHLRGSEPKMQVLDHSRVNINILSGNRRGILLTGNSSSTIVSSGYLIMNLAGSGVGYSASGTTNSLSVEESEVNIYGNSGHNIYLEGNNSIFRLNNSVTNLEAGNSGRNIWLVGSDTVFSVENGAKVKTTSDNANSITLHGARPLLKMSGYQTNMETISNVSAAETNASIFLGAASTGAGSSNPNAEINLSEGAKLSVHSNRSSAMSLLSSNGQFNLLNQAELNLTSGNTDSSANGAVAVLRFIRVGGYKFTIDNAKMNISKTGGRTPGIRMNGGNNHIEVKNGGQFFIYNPGNGTPINQDTTSGLANQGVHYPNGGNNSFIVDGIGSSVEIISDFGPAIDMESQIGKVEARNQATFIAEGRTSTDAAGIFNAGNLTVKFDNPLFMDFRNNRPGGGNIFNVTNGSTLSATNSDLSVWKKGVNLEEDPDLDFRSIDYSFSGSNFNTLGETSDSDQLNTSVFGSVGLTAYSRLSSNNARWSIVDELRIPTDADKKINGRVSIPVGLDNSRPAWTNESEVTIEVEKANGDKKNYTSKTVGHSDDSKGISIYGEEPRGGLFEIDLDEPLEAGSKVRVIKVELTSGELTDGFEHQILTETVEVFPIIPPTPAQFSSSIIAQDSTTIQGMTDNLDAEVTATHNGKLLNTEDVTVEADGKFTLDLSGISLEMDDEIQVFLRDAEGSALEAGVINPPETNNTRGNINPSTELTFHDATFESATTLMVGDLGPVLPLDPLDPEVEVNPENKPLLPEDQGQLSIDFVSSFNFGSQAISVHDQTYYAQPQRLLNEDGTVNVTEERPNYVQISDRRSENERNGWELAVTQKEQFTGTENQVLRGATLILSNQEIVTVQGGTAPEIQSINELVPGNRLTLLKAQGSEGTGTWIYRFGNGKTAGESVVLDVPRGTNPENITYYTALIWELSAVPDN